MIYGDLSNTELLLECVELYLNSLNAPSWRGAQLKHTDSFIFTFTFAKIFWGVTGSLSDGLIVTN